MISQRKNEHNEIMINTKDFIFPIEFSKLYLIVETTEISDTILDVHKKILQMITNR